MCIILLVYSYHRSENASKSCSVVFFSVRTISWGLKIYPVDTKNAVRFRTSAKKNAVCCCEEHDSAPGWTAPHYTAPRTPHRIESYRTAPGPHRITSHHTAPAPAQNRNAPHRTRTEPHRTVPTNQVARAQRITHLNGSVPLGRLALPACLLVVCLPSATTQPRPYALRRVSCFLSCFRSFFNARKNKNTHNSNMHAPTHLPQPLLLLSYHRTYWYHMVSYEACTYVQYL